MTSSTLTSADGKRTPSKVSAADSRAVDQESRRIIREELLTNILVEAGAGSGKTQMLAERMAAGVAAGVYQVEQMAAVTFTRKAASELRGRFHLALEQRLSRGPRENKAGGGDGCQRAQGGSVDEREGQREERRHEQ